ncbi:hypothetical protein GYH30_012034 [Glycine max]|nr:hypothetical protein GYH30_012034 [Glycine max]
MRSQTVSDHLRIPPNTPSTMPSYPPEPQYLSLSILPPPSPDFSA